MAEGRHSPFDPSDISFAAVAALFFRGFPCSLSSLCLVMRTATAAVTLFMRDLFNTLTHTRAAAVLGPSLLQPVWLQDHVRMNVTIVTATSRLDAGKYEQTV